MYVAVFGQFTYILGTERESTRRVAEGLQDFR